MGSCIQRLVFRLQGCCANVFHSGSRLQEYRANDFHPYFVCRSTVQTFFIHFSFAGVPCKRFLLVFRLQGHPANVFCPFFVCRSIVQTISVHFSFAGASCKRFLSIFCLQEHRANDFYPFFCLQEHRANEFCPFSLTKISFLISLQVKPYCIFAYRVCYKCIY